MPQSPVTFRLAVGHEAVFVKLEALQKSVLAIAAKRPEAVVGEATRAVAEGLLLDCRPYLSGNSLPKMAADHGGLAVQLGQALAGLAAYEARHSDWSDYHGFHWRLVNGQKRTIGRLRQSFKDSGRITDPDLVAIHVSQKRSMLAIAKQFEKNMKRREANGF